MTERERRLLGLLGAAAVLAACALLAAAGLDRLRDVDSSLERYRGQMARLETRAQEDTAGLEARIAELKASVDGLEERARGAGPTADLAGFGAAVRRSLTSSGAMVLRYQPAPAARKTGDGTGTASDVRVTAADLLEFTGRGSALALCRFLAAAADMDWGVPFLSVRSETASAPVEFTLRIGHGY